MGYIIRQEAEKDIQAVYDLNKVAFEQGLEGGLVNALRKSDADVISLVAESDGKITGHIMFSPVYIDGEVAGMGLAPMAVLPGYQKQGIGSALIDEGLKIAQNKGYSLVVVLGHPEYYPKFGFVPASKYGLKSTYEVPDEVFMAINYNEYVWDYKTIHYRDEFKIFD